MRWSRSDKAQSRDKEKPAMPRKYRYPNLTTYDPYLVDIVRMLEQLRKEQKH